MFQLFCFLLLPFTAPSHSVPSDPLRLSFSSLPKSFLPRKLDSRLPTLPRSAHHCTEVSKDPSSLSFTFMGSRSRPNRKRSSSFFSPGTRWGTRFLSHRSPVSLSGLREPPVVLYKSEVTRSYPSVIPHTFSDDQQRGTGVGRSERKKSQDLTNSKSVVYGCTNLPGKRSEKTYIHTGILIRGQLFCTRLHYIRRRPGSRILQTRTREGGEREKE